MNNETGVPRPYVCPNCQRALAYPLEACAHGRCPRCHYKPDRVKRGRTRLVRKPKLTADQILEELKREPCIYTAPKGDQRK